jgi:hypothetical protein
MKERKKQNKAGKIEKTKKKEQTSERTIESNEEKRRK